MKIFPSFLLFFCSPLLFPSPGAQCENSLAASDCVPLTAEAFDYFNFSAMQDGPAGRALRERIFSEIKESEDTSALLHLLNGKYALGVPESVERAVITKFSFPHDGEFNTAEFEFAEAPADTPGTALRFFQSLRQQAFPWESYPGNIDPTGKELPAKANLSHSETPPLNDVYSATPGCRQKSAEKLCKTNPDNQAIAFPQELVKKLPKAFLENTQSVSVTATSPNTITVIAASEVFPEIPDFRKTETYTHALANAARPGTLVYRRFQRRATQISGFALSFPPGEFSIIEENKRAKIFVEFRCRDAQEAVFMEHFFLRFKLSMLESADRQPDTTRERLLSVGSALAITRSDAILKLRIDCDAENFPAFLKWRNSWFPKR